MNVDASQADRLRYGLSVITRSELHAWEIDAAGEGRGPVEWDLQLNNRTYWYRPGSPQGPVEWACRLLERLGQDMPLSFAGTVIEPPSQAFQHTFLLYPWDHEQPTVAECGHLRSWTDSVPEGRFHGEAGKQELDQGAYGMSADLWAADPPLEVTDEFGDRRSVMVSHQSHLWLVGGAWTAADADAIEAEARVPQPFYVFGPDATIRPAHPWDPDGNLP